MFKIIEQQADFIIINKSANVNFHDEGELGKGLFNQVKQACGLSGELFPVHRLDKMTSGLIIFAKTLACAQHFQQLFSEHTIEKYYLAISEQKPKKKQGVIKGDMAKSRRGSWKLLRTMENPAITQFFSYALTQGKRLYLLKPHSGKSHQIRVALNSIGAPILGDDRYCDALKQKTNSGTDTKEETAPKIDRGYLHAYALKFTYQSKEYQYVLPPSEGVFYDEPHCKNQIAKIAQPWLLPWPKI